GLPSRGGNPRNRGGGDFWGRGLEMGFGGLVLGDLKASLKYLSDPPKLQGIAKQNSFKHT
ncbi:hypothetical protein KCA24_20045, partial [Escherichia coli]|nr:hypothetical protein [Escherichia coli]